MQGGGSPDPLHIGAQGSDTMIGGGSDGAHDPAYGPGSGTQGPVNSGDTDEGSKGTGVQTLHFPNGHGGHG
jgi:hypothetical protein